LRGRKAGEELERLEVFVGEWEVWNDEEGMVLKPLRRVARFAYDVVDGGREICLGSRQRLKAIFNSSVWISSVWIDTLEIMSEWASVQAKGRRLNGIGIRMRGGVSGR
jgi:hypothetical protein